MTELAAGRRATARALERHFGVSEKTAKRDIATLKTEGFSSSWARGEPADIASSQTSHEASSWVHMGPSLAAASFFRP